jgi:hypothetical protein
MVRHRTHLFPRLLSTGSALIFHLVIALTLAGSAGAAFAQEPGAPAPDFLAPGRTSADDPIPPPPPRPINPCGGTGQAGHGIALQTSLGGRLLTVAAADAASFTSGPQWNVLVGYKFCRVLIGLSLDLSVESPAGTSTTTTSFLLAPEVQFAMARSADHRAELIGAISIGVGTVGGNGHVAARLGPGVRYWVHPHIALSTLVGLSGDIVMLGKNQAALVSLFGTVGVLGAF